MNVSLIGAKKDIINKISTNLENLGIMFRIFGRIKDVASLSKKLEKNEEYIQCKKKIQDILGVRIVLYFPDDISIVHKVISNLYDENNKDASIDELNAETFKPIRYNLIYKLPEKTSIQYDEYIEYIDSTFELQIRTVLSEGWHEVEHDLRYKFKSDWDNLPDEHRKFNGVYASLETSEWTMLQILHSIAYKHYKNRNWEAMLRQHFRMKLVDFKLNQNIINIFNANNELAKSFFKLERNVLISKMYDKRYEEPLNINNIIYFANAVFIKNKNIEDLTPIEFLNEFKE